MKKIFRNTMIALMLVSVGAMSTGCYGSFGLTTKLHEWNGQVSNKKGINELVFIAFCIIPAYEVCALADAIVLNSIEFWGGNNPVAMDEGQIDESNVKYKGKNYRVIKTKNNVAVEAINGTESASFRYFPEEQEWYLMDGDAKVEAVKVKGNKPMKHLS